MSCMGSKSSRISTNSAKLTFGSGSGEGTARRCCCKHGLRLPHRCQKERERSVFWSNASAHTYLDNFVTLAKYDCVIPISQIRGSICKFEEFFWQWQSLLDKISASLSIQLSSTYMTKLPRQSYWKNSLKVQQTIVGVRCFIDSSLERLSIHNKRTCNSLSGHTYNTIPDS